MQDLIYFAADGSYGEAKDLIIIDTRGWTQEEWAIIDDASDEDRARIAHALKA